MQDWRYKARSLLEGSAFIAIEIPISEHPGTVPWVCPVTEESLCKGTSCSRILAKQFRPVHVPDYIRSCAGIHGKSVVNVRRGGYDRRCIEQPRKLRAKAFALDVTGQKRVKTTPIRQWQSRQGRYACRERGAQSHEPHSRAPTDKHIRPLKSVVRGYRRAADGLKAFLPKRSIV